MKRYVVILYLMIAYGGFLFSAPRDKIDVVRIAQQNIPVTPVGDSDKQYAVTPEVEQVDSSYSYFIFNADSSFVLVSSDDRFPAVLGYGDSPFDPNDMSPAMVDFLAKYDKELLYLDSIKQTAPANDFLASSFSDNQPALLTSRWRQSAPYNDLAPYYASGKRSVTGCVATAMAQIMYYWKHPAKGTGSHAYYWESSVDSKNFHDTLRADFGSTTYDWGNMLDSYTGVNYTTDQARAVATLLYHCGVAVEMGYGASSGAYTTDVPPALNNYFGYDPNYQMIMKDNYPTDSFITIVHDEIRQLRPVLVAGSNSQGGHAFVCDGYNSNGYFHINWGWGGTSDGYFLLTGLTPSQQGIGGTSSGYNTNTRFFIGIQPYSSMSKPARSQMFMDSFTVSKSCLGRYESFSVVAKSLANFGYHTFSGYCYVVLADEDNNPIYRISGKRRISELLANYMFPSFTFSGVRIDNLTVDLPDGIYRVYLMYDDDNYEQMRLMARKSSFYRTIYLSGDTACIIPNSLAPDLSLKKTIAFKTPDSIPMTGDSLFFSVQNDGGRFIGDISARIYQGEYTAKGQYQICSNCTITMGSTLDTALINAFGSNISINTTYTMQLRYKQAGASTWETMQPLDKNSIQFKVFGYNTRLTDEACSGEDYSNYGFDIKSGDLPTLGKTKRYTRRVAVTSERDSVILLTLTTKAPPSKSMYVTICDGHSYTFRERTYSQEMSDTIRVSQASGCDSVYYINISVNPPIDSVVRATICSGKTFAFHGQTYSQATTSEPYLWRENSERACDTVFRIYLTVKSIIDSAVRATICDGRTFNFRGREYTEPTTNKPYEIRVPASSEDDCDSVFHLYLTVLPPFDSTIKAYICSETSYTFRGVEYQYRPDGNPHQIRAASNKVNVCDTIFNLYIIRREQYEKDLHISICQGDTFRFNGYDYAEASTQTPYAIIVPQEDACDSIYHLYLTVKQPVDSTVRAHICSANGYLFHGNYYYSEGSTTKPFRVEVGGATEEECDTIFSLYLIVSPSFDSTIRVNLCKGDTFYFRGQGYATSTNNSPHRIIARAASPSACDTTFYLHINVRNLNLTTIHRTICQGDKFTFRGVDYTEDRGDNPYIVRVSQENDCDSVYYIYLTVKPPFVDYIYATICQDDAYEFRGEEYTTATEPNNPYVISVKGENFCDSTYYLYLTVEAQTVDTINAYICPGDVFEYNGHRYTQPRNEPYRDTVLTQSTSCDDIYVIYLRYATIDTVLIPVVIDSYTTTLPYVVDKNFTVSPDITSDTTIILKVPNRIGRCSYNAYKITFGSDVSGINDVTTDLVKIEVRDILGRVLYQHDCSTSGALPIDENGLVKDQSFIDNLNLPQGVFLIHYFFKDGSSKTYKKEIKK